MTAQVRLPRELGELATPLAALPAGTPVAEVEAMLRADPLLPGVIVAAADGYRVLSRAALQRRAAGPDRGVAALAGPGTLMLSAGTAIDVAATAALARSDEHRDEPLLVRWPDGRCGIAPTVDLLAVLAGRYARLSRLDPLTGLPHRAAALAEGRQRLEAGGLAGVLHLDLDRFAEANDMLGHAGADLLLRRVAEALRAACRGEDLVARLEGDQFLVLLAAPAPAAGLAQLGRRLAAAVRGPHLVDGVPVSVDASAGVCAADHRDLAVLHRRATTAMRTAKRDRLGVTEWRPPPTGARRSDLGQLTELRAGIRDGHLRLHYQPLHDAHTRRVHGAEALVRWQHPQRGLLPPGAFLPDAERSDVILHLTDWVLADALRQAASWHRSGTSLPVSVNLSAAYLAQDRAVPTILALLGLAGLPPELLTVEITETAVLARPEEAAARLAEIRAAGIRVAIDDFGTGYTSLGLLPRLPVDELKIDRSFVARMHESRPHATIVEAVVSIARALDLSVVAEGVEDEPAAAALAAAGVDLLQGYHLNRPRPPGELALPTDPIAVELHRPPGILVPAAHQP